MCLFQKKDIIPISSLLMKVNILLLFPFTYMSQMCCLCLLSITERADRKRAKRQCAANCSKIPDWYSKSAVCMSIECSCVFVCVCVGLRKPARCHCDKKKAKKMAFNIHLSSVTSWWSGLQWIKSLSQAQGRNTPYRGHQSIAPCTHIHI